MTTRQPPTLTILYIYCTGGTGVPQSHTWHFLHPALLTSGTSHIRHFSHPAVCDRCETGACQYHLCSIYIQNCEAWWLSSCRKSVAEHWLYKPGVLGSIPGNCVALAVHEHCQNFHPSFSFLPNILYWVGLFFLSVFQ